MYSYIRLDSLFSSQVMLRSGTHGGVVLVDYGFATKHGGGREKATNVVGTVGYLAPELLTEGALVDLRCPQRCKSLSKVVKSSTKS